MRTIEIYGKQIKTNLDEHYSIDPGNGRETMRMALKGLHETDSEMFERLAKVATKKITFFRVTTAVPGYYDIIAYWK